MPHTEPTPESQQRDQDSSTKLATPAIRMRRRDQAESQHQTENWLENPWRATLGFELAAFVRQRPVAEGSPEVAPLARLGNKLCEWLSSYGPTGGLQLQLRGDAAKQTLRVVVLAQFDGATEEETALRAEANAVELQQLLGACNETRFEALDTPDRLDQAIVGHEWLHGRMAIPIVRSVNMPGYPDLPVCESWRPHGAEALGDVVRLMLSHAGPVTAVLSLTGVADQRPLFKARALSSLLLARLGGLLPGVHFRADEGRAMVHCLPENLLELDRIASTVKDFTDWLDALDAGALSVRVAVLGRNTPSRPLLASIQRAVVGMNEVRWQELTSDQGEMLAHGPSDAHDCPVAYVSDVGIHADPVHEALTKWIPGRVAGRMLQVPPPGEDGLPNIGMEAAPSRPLPASVLATRGEFLMGLGEGPSGPVPVRITGNDLARHVYLCGKTGVGKSTVLRTLIIDAALQGASIGLIDPHGDLVDDVRARIEPHRKVHIFDPADPNCLGLDPLAHDGTPEGAERAIEELMAIMFRLYSTDYMGPLFDRHSRCLLVPLTVARKPLAEMSRLCSDQSFRNDCLKSLDRANPLHEEVRRFWTSEYPDWSSQFRGEMTSYTVSKYDALLKSSVLRRVCDPERAQFDMARVVNEGGVVLARLPQGVLGPMSAYFLGMQLVSRLQDVVFSRAKMAPEDRKPFTLVLDEFHNFLGAGGYAYSPKGERTLGPMLSEARKFGLRLVLANQYVAQLDEGTLDALMGNVGSTVCFRVGASDAALLAEEYGRRIPADELTEQPLYHGLTRLLTGGEIARPFTLQSIPPSALEAHLEWPMGKPDGQVCLPVEAGGKILGPQRDELAGGPTREQDGDDGLASVR